MPPTITHVAPPPHARISASTVIAAMLLLAAAFALTWGSAAPVHVTVDGVGRSVQPRTSLRDLVAAHFTTGSAGTLLSVDGRIARVAGGDPVSYTRNGVQVTDTALVYDGDVITSRSGADRIEPTEVGRASIAPTTTVQGSGPILKTMSQGKPGVSLVRRGAVSGQVVSASVTFAIQHPLSCGRTMIHVAGVYIGACRKKQIGDRA